MPLEPCGNRKSFVGTLGGWKHRASNKANLFYASSVDIGHWKKEKEEDLPAHTVLIVVT
jgi:hypothetical protein